MITELTTEQEAQIPVFIEKWVRQASEPLVRENSIKWVKELFGEDTTVLFAESIQNGVDLVRFITSGKKFERDTQLDYQLDTQLSNQLYNQLGNEKIKYSSYTTQYWLRWLGWYDYGMYIGAKLDNHKYNQLKEIILAIPIIISLGKIMIVIENPQCSWERGLLHNDQKPAIAWRDDTGIYLLDGVRFEKDLWGQVVSKEMSFGDILKIENADQRTVALKYNPEAIIAEGATLLHKDNRNNELYLIENKEINKITRHDKMYFLKMTCPTGRVFIEAVPPDLAEKHPSASVCQAELCGLTLEEYLGMKLEA